MTWTIKQLAPATNLETDETYQRATSCEIMYYAKSDTDADEADVVDAMRASDVVVKKYLGMSIQRFTVSERINSKNWKVSAEYKYTGGGDYSSGLNDDEDDGDIPAEKVSIEFATTTATRTVSLNRVSTHGDCPLYGGLIDVQESGDGTLEPRGVSILVPTGTMTITHYFPRSQWTANLRKKIAYRRCRYNSSTFRGYSEGELLFVGENVSYSQGDSYVEVQYKFLISENDTVQVGGFSVPKKGWHALWTKYKKNVATIGGKKYQTIIPQGVAVEKVYKSCDFDELGIKRNG